jgi:hypothetical protein
LAKVGGSKALFTKRTHFPFGLSKPFKGIQSVSKRFKGPGEKILSQRRALPRFSRSTWFKTGQLPI